MKQRVMKDLRGDAIAATDGELGSVKDAYFDDERWAVRYLVVDTGGWLAGRKVLISPASLDAEVQDDRHIRARLTRKEVEDSPGLEADRPVSRLYEQAHAHYFRYPPYWQGPYLWGFAPMPMLAAARDEAIAAEGAMRHRAEAGEKAAEQSHLRSTAEVVGYRIHARDGTLGKVDDLVVDDADWSVQGMVVDTREWLPGGEVVVPRSAVTAIDWKSREVRVDMSREELKRSPPAAS